MARGMRDDEWVEVHVHCHAQGAKAVLISDSGDEADAKWIPKSQISGCPPRGEEGDIEMKTWIAEKEGFA